MAKIKRFGVLKTAGFTGLYMFFIGFIFSLVMWIGVTVLSGLFSSLPGASVTSNFSLLYVFILPFFYGITGFVSGLILTPLMNLALKITKGLDLDLEVSGQTY